MRLGWSIILICAGFAAAPAHALQNPTIEGYSDKRSAQPGETITFSLHVPDGTGYRVTYYRFGGAAPEVMLGPQTFNNGAAREYTSTSYVDGLNWPASFNLIVPPTWRSGLYVARVASTQNPGIFFDITFIVRSYPGTEKDILVIASTNTWDAYNFWPGGSSFYALPSCGVSYKQVVSFRRPNPYATPEAVDRGPNCTVPEYLRTEHLAAGEARILRWLERHGYDYSMLTDYDLHVGWNEATKNSALDPFDTVIISTHNEYWSDAMYKSFQSYLARGGNVISLSGNTAYRRVLIDVAAQTITNVYVGAATQLWDNLAQSPDPAWTDFVPKKNLFGFSFYSGAVTHCAGYAPTSAAMSSANKLAHWSFAGVTNGAVLGATGEIAANSSRCLNGTSGAAGEEVDMLATAFQRELTLLGVHSGGLPGHVIHLRRPSAGQVFSIASITAGGSFAADDPPLTSLLQNVLARFAQRSRSDFNGDGFTDVIARRSSDGRLVRYAGDGAGHLGAGTAFDSGWAQFSRLVSPGDFDSDGHADLLAQHPNGALVFYRGTGQGTLMQTLPVTIDSAWTYVEMVTPGDFDGDGRADVLGRASNGTIWLHRGNGAGGFAAPGVQIDSGWQIYVELFSPGDFDEDGRPDLIARRPDGTLWFYRGVGDGTIMQIPPVQIDSGWSIYQKLFAAGDFDRDGHADVFAITTSGTLFYYRGQGNGTFIQIPAIQIGNTNAHSGLDLLLSVW
jgi:hypothetical protein